MLCRDAVARDTGSARMVIARVLKIFGHVAARGRFGVSLATAASSVSHSQADAVLQAHIEESDEDS